ncbi:MAG: hypothetical protein IJS43_04280, partial [Bacteroidaceae bacterium]|nr:hypothetical protein [Bacteroidaceae bacterium]
MGKEITTKTDQKDLVSSQTTAEVFKRSPLQWVPTLYFAMGVPFVVLNMVCSLMFKGLQVSDTQIA